MLATNENMPTAMSSATPISSIGKGLLSFSKTKEGQILLAKYPALFTEDNFNTALTEGEDAGKTLLWFFARKPIGRMLLGNYPELLKQANMNAGPTQGLFTGITVLWWLAASPVGRVLLAQQPGLLKQRNLEAAPTSDNTITVLQLLVKNRCDVFKNPIVAHTVINAGLGKHLTTLLSDVKDDPGLEKLFILAGAQALQTPNWYKKTIFSLTNLFNSSEYSSLKEQLNKDLEKGIKILFINSPSLKQIDQPILYEIMYYYFFSLHPDLAFMGINTLKQLIDQKLPFLHDEPLYILTLRTLKAYAKMQNARLSIKLDKEREREIKNMTLSALKEAIAERLIRPWDITNEFCNLFVNSIKYCKNLKKVDIENVIKHFHSIQQSTSSPMSQLAKPYK